MDFQHDILPLKNIIFRTALRIVLNREEAEDIVQDTLMKLWQKRDELSKVQNLESFAIASARNLALDRKGKMENRNLTFNEVTHDRPDEFQLPPDEAISNQEGHNVMEEIMNSLPEKQRIALHLRDIEEKSYKEIAEALNITESDVKVTIFRARNEVKEKILQKKAFFL